MISNIMGQYLILDIALYKRYRGEDNMIHFLKFFKADNSDDSSPELVDNTILEDEENNGTKKTEVFYPYMIYSNKDNQIIGEIELTYDQASKLNEVNRRDGVYRQDIVFLRK